jgi:hypothetical protein
MKVIHDMGATTLRNAAQALTVACIECEGLMPVVLHEIYDRFQQQPLPRDMKHQVKQLRKAASVG